MFDSSNGGTMSIQSLENGLIAQGGSSKQQLLLTDNWTNIIGLHNTILARTIGILNHESS